MSRVCPGCGTAASYGVTGPLFGVDESGWCPAALAHAARCQAPELAEFQIPWACGRCLWQDPAIAWFQWISLLDNIFVMVVEALVW